MRLIKCLVSKVEETTHTLSLRFAGISFLCNILIITAVFAQPTPHKQLYVHAWNGVYVKEHAAMKSKVVAHLRYGDSVWVSGQHRERDTVNISICKAHTITKNATKIAFSEWRERAEWIFVRSPKGSGFIPSVYLSDKPPLLLDSAIQRAREGIDEYFFRTRGLLEGKPVHRNIEDVGRYYRRSVFPLYDVNRSVYAGGVVFERWYSASDHDNFLLILPDWSLVEAYHFLNTLFNLEPQQRRGFEGNIRLIKKEEHTLVFSNLYATGRKKGIRPQQFIIQQINETVIITKEELIVND